MKKIKVTFTFKKIGRIAKEELAYKLLFFGMLISFLGSLNPWFMWSIGALYPILSLVFLSLPFFCQMHPLKVSLQKGNISQLLSFI